MSDDKDNIIRQRTFEVKYLGERPSISYEKARISKIELRDEKEEAEKEFQKRIDYTQKDLN